MIFMAITARGDPLLHKRDARSANQPDTQGGIGRGQTDREHVRVGPEKRIAKLLDMGLPLADDVRLRFT
jgi:hypothetical protein